jgi:hypothetical protein
MLAQIVADQIARYLTDVSSRLAYCQPESHIRRIAENLAHRGAGI